MLLMMDNFFLLGRFMMRFIMDNFLFLCWLVRCFVMWLDVSCLFLWLFCGRMDFLLWCLVMGLFVMGGLLVWLFLVCLMVGLGFLFCLGFGMGLLDFFLS